MNRCDDCGKVGDDVADTLDPFALELADEAVPATLCRDCYEIRSDEI